MRFWKTAFLAGAALLLLSVCTVYVSCTRDTCLDLTCKNGGSCFDGVCNCRTGYEGVECEVKTTSRFLGKYSGTLRCDQRTATYDTAVVFLLQEPLTVGIVIRSMPSDTFKGTVADNIVTIPDIVGANSGRYVRATLDTARTQVDSGRLSLFVENVTDAQNKKKSVCSFIGFRR